MTDPPEPTEFDTSGLLHRARRMADLSQRDLAARAGAGRLHPAHLDPEPLWREGWLRANRVFRDDRLEPIAALERRTLRDRTRRREGTPEDHPGIELTRQPPLPPQPNWFEDNDPVPECECGPECERACEPECSCQCEPPLPGQMTWGVPRSAA